MPKVTKETKKAKKEEVVEDDDHDIGTYYLYVVQDGDSYRTIADRYHVDEYTIQNYNHNRDLSKGTIVIVPYIACLLYTSYPDDIVIGADTVVYFQNQIIGKAKDENEAKYILNLLSHQMHSVYTSVAIYFQDELMTFIDRTDVYFKDISHLIDSYIASGEWEGKAGAYGIQGTADCFVDHVNGDIDNVIGLPLQRVMNIFKEKDVLL